MSETADDSTPELVTAARVRDPRLQLLVAAYAALYVAANIGSVMAPRLVKHHPAVLILTSARIRHLLFVIPAGLGAVPYGVIGAVRMVLAATVCYLLGRWYGARGLTWLDRQLDQRRPATLRWLEVATDRVGWLVLLLMPGSNIVCALVGHRKLSPRRFAVIVAIGTGLRLWWVWLAAHHWEKSLKKSLDWIGRYQWWLVAGFLAVTIFQAWRRTAASGTSN